MKLFAINGSPRKKWNTAVLLEKALEGAASAGAETEIVHLYDLDYRGCTSCFACKMVGGKSEGRCAMRDGLTPVLKKIEEEAGALIIRPHLIEGEGSPVTIAEQDNGPRLPVI